MYTLALFFVHCWVPGTVPDAVSIQQIFIELMKNTPSQATYHTLHPQKLQHPLT